MGAGWGQGTAMGAGSLQTQDGGGHSLLFPPPPAVASLEEQKIALLKELSALAQTHGKVRPPGPHGHPLLAPSPQLPPAGPGIP